MAEMPRRLEPIEGAEAVDFPWAEASAAVTALNDARAALRDHMAGRLQMRDMVNGWQGGHRDTFDERVAGVSGDADSAEGELARLAGAIIDGAMAANERQARLNHQADLTVAG